MKKLFVIGLLLTVTYAAMFEDNKRLCDKGNMVGCFNLGVLHMKGFSGAQKNESIALKYFNKACNGGDIDGCLNAGKYFEEGEDVRQDLFKAVEFYTKACDGGEAYACMILANLYRDGKGTIKPDSSIAAGYYKKVCEKGYSEGCKQYNKIRK